MRARIFAEENRKWWTLGAVAFGLFMIMLDNTVVFVALSSIQSDLKISQSELEWVVSGYALTFAVLMLTGGKLADMFGRRRIFIVGLAIFTASSLACGLATGAGFLIGARVVQGVGAALMNPATLSIIVATFPPRQRGTAIGIWVGVSAMALAIGPLIGGILTEQINWSWIFFINVPVGIAGIVVSRLFITESRDESKEQRLDLPGLLSSAIGLFGLTYALIEGNNYGWSSGRILASFAVAAIGLVTFVLLEHRQRVPMLDLSLFKNSTFSGANVTMLLVALAMFGVFFFNSLYLGQVLGYSPIQTGAAFLPLTVLDRLRRPARRSVLGQDRLALAHGCGARPAQRLAAELLDPGRRLDLLGHRPWPDSRWLRDVARDDSDDGGGNGLGSRRQGWCRLGRAEQHEAGRRFSRNRPDGRDRRLVGECLANEP